MPPELPPSCAPGCAASLISRYPDAHHFGCGTVRGATHPVFHTRSNLLSLARGEPMQVTEQDSQNVPEDLLGQIKELLDYYAL